MIKQIRQQIIKRNGQKFLDDIKNVSDVMVFAQKSDAFLRTTKNEVFKRAAEDKINYYMTDKVFANRRIVMVIL